MTILLGGGCMFGYMVVVGLTDRLFDRLNVYQGSCRGDGKFSAVLWPIFLSVLAGAFLYQVMALILNKVAELFRARKKLRAEKKEVLYEMPMRLRKKYGLSSEEYRVVKEMVEKYELKLPVHER